jgi:flagellar basal-body rod modification protein FlgD
MATAIGNHIAPLTLPRGNLEGELTGSSAQQTQDRFLRLLITQMRNQDPLNPLDNAQVTSQFAQISTVTGIDRLNRSMSEMSSAVLSAQTMQSASMIGRTVLVPAATLRHDGGGAPAAVELRQPADSVVVTLRDAAGHPVRRIDLGGQPAGVVPFSWDGRGDSGSRLPSGAYRMDVVAVRAGQRVEAQALATGTVRAVELGAGGAQLEVEGIGAAGLAQVRRIY